MSDDRSGSLGEKLGDGLVWIVDHVTVNGTLALTGIMIVAYFVWRLSLALGPTKICWRCTGKGHIGGLLGGRRTCPSCKDGRRPRVGSGGRR